MTSSTLSRSATSAKGTDQEDSSFGGDPVFGSNLIVIGPFGLIAGPDTPTDTSREFYADCAVFDCVSNPVYTANTSSCAVFVDDLSFAPVTIGAGLVSEGKQFWEQFMPTDQQEVEALQGSAKSRLGESLLRLHRRLEQSRDEENQGENLFRIWQMKWFGRKDQISRRLQLVESQLQRTSQRGPTRVRLSVVGAPADDDGTTPNRMAGPAAKAMFQRVTVH